MMPDTPPQPVSPPGQPPLRLSLGIVGHRESNAAYTANRDRIQTVVDGIFDAVAALLSDLAPRVSGSVAPVRLHSLLAEGVDQLAANSALARGWELVAPLPFGRRLNMAINAHPATAGEARALLDGGGVTGETLQRRADAIRSLTEKSRAFELADADDAIAELFLAMFDSPGDAAPAQQFAARCSARVALAGRVLIEQSDIVVAVWDGQSRTFVGGTGHTIAAALEMGAPVIWIDAHCPENWRILRAPESLAFAAAPSADDRAGLLASLVLGVLLPAEGSKAPHQADRDGIDLLEQLSWHSRSSPLFHAYRRVEALFGGEPAPFRSLRQTYELPQAIAAGSEAPLLAAIQTLPGADPQLARRIEAAVLGRFAWADGVSTHYSDRYRGGMVANFLSSGMAIVAGTAYLPLAGSEAKWLFALAEFMLLAAILMVTALGQRRKWHSRWFETRRVAEYLRHSPILLVLGVARPPGRWPKGTHTSWPECYARRALREVGLPAIAVNHAYLRAALRDLLDRHVVYQRDYHVAKARRLNRVHRNLDRLSHVLFQLAVVSVSLYLLLKVGAMLSIVPEAWSHRSSHLFTFLGLLFPTFGATIAGIRFFGDFERFAAISEVTAEKLGAVHQRADLLLSAPDSMLDYHSIADLAHAADDIVVSEIENWQAVFGGKHLTVPV